MNSFLTSQNLSHGLSIRSFPALARTTEDSQGFPVDVGNPRWIEKQIDRGRPADNRQLALAKPNS
jgi:hypothetical protein